MNESDQPELGVRHTWDTNRGHHFRSGLNHLLRCSHDLSVVPSPLCLFLRLLDEEPEARVGADCSAQPG